MGSARGRSGNMPAVIVFAVAVMALANSGKHAAAAKHHATSRAQTVSVTSGSETAFIRAALADLGAPATQADMASMAAWERREYPSWPPGAQNNPWDSTLYEPGSWAFNTFGGLHVWNYPTATEGAHATALTLEGGLYPLIVSALRSGAGLCGQPALAGEFRTWSGGGYSSAC